MPNPIKACINPDCGKRVYCLDRNHCAKCWQKFTEEGRAYNAQRQRDHVAKTKAHFAAVAAMKVAPLLLICAGAGWGSAWHPGQQIPDPGIRTQPTRPKPKPAQTLAYRYDPDGLLVSYQDRRYAPLPVPAGYRRFGGGLAFDYAGAAAARSGDSNGEKPKPPKPPNPPRPPGVGVPGPLPLLGLAAMFGWARQMRRRVGK